GEGFPEGEALSSATLSAGIVLDNLRLKLFDQAGGETSLGPEVLKDSCSVVCSWDPTWKWSGEKQGGQGDLGKLPPLKVPHQISELDGGVFSLYVKVYPEGGKHLVAEVEVNVSAGHFDHWVAVLEGTEERVKSLGSPLVAVSGGEESEPCFDAFCKVIKGFSPSDIHGNPTQYAGHPPDIHIEGMPNLELRPSPCRLIPPVAPGGKCWTMPEGIAIRGPRCEGGCLVIGGQPGPGVGRQQGGKSGGADAGGDDGNLRLGFAVRAGPVARLELKSPSMGAEQFTGGITASLPIGYQVDDLVINLLDKVGAPATLPPGGVEVCVEIGDTRQVAGGGVSSKKRLSSPMVVAGPVQGETTTCMVPPFALKRDFLM
ncbi:unnamed protein product, partial [Discosporangium mesarthrocarpum]